jgi:hypothetical protein
MTTVRTNNHSRHFVYRHDVPAEVLADQFDYLDDDQNDGFFKYLGTWYHTSQFTLLRNAPEAFEGWDGIHNESFFSGVVIDLSDDGEEYRVGRYY